MTFQPGKSGNQATMFKPGQSGNPAGRPKELKNWSTLVRQVLADENILAELVKTLPPKKVPKWFADLPDKRLGNAIIVAMAIKAVSGDDKAANFLRKTGYGDKLDLTVDGRIIQPLKVLDMGMPVKPKSKPKAKKKGNASANSAKGSKPKAKRGVRSSSKPKDTKA